MLADGGQARDYLIRSFRDPNIARARKKDFRSRAGSPDRDQRRVHEVYCSDFAESILGMDICCWFC